MIDRHLLRYFLAVVDQGNFSSGARHCRVTQPTLSVGIARLEDLLGRSLFNRTNRRVELTPAGARLVAPARRIETEFAEAERAALDEAPVSTIRIGLMSTLPSAWIEAAIEAACGAPTERVEIVDARAKEIPALMERGRIDAGIGLRRDRYLPGCDLWTEGYALALPLRHPFAEKRSVRPEEVAAEVMFVRRDCEALAEVSRYFTSRGIRPFMSARTHAEDRAVSYVRAGLGITVMPACFEGEQLSLVPLAGFGLRRTIGLMLSPDKPDLAVKSQALGRLVATLCSLAAQARNVSVSEDGLVTPD